MEGYILNYVWLQSLRFQSYKQSYYLQMSCKPNAIGKDYSSSSRFCSGDVDDPDSSYLSCGSVDKASSSFDESAVDSTWESDEAGEEVSFASVAGLTGSSSFSSVPLSSLSVGAAEESCSGFCNTPRLEALSGPLTCLLGRSCLEPGLLGRERFTVPVLSTPDKATGPSPLSRSKAKIPIDSSPLSP